MHAEFIGLVVGGALLVPLVVSLAACLRQAVQS